MTVAELQGVIAGFPPDMQIYYYRGDRIVELGHAELTQFEGYGPDIILLQPQP